MLGALWDKMSLSGVRSCGRDRRGCSPQVSAAVYTPSSQMAGCINANFDEQRKGRAWGRIAGQESTLKLSGFLLFFFFYCFLIVGVLNLTVQQKSFILCM